MLEAEIDVMQHQIGEWQGAGKTWNSEKAGSTFSLRASKTGPNPAYLLDFYFQNCKIKFLLFNIPGYGTLLYSSASKLIGPEWTKSV